MLERAQKHKEYSVKEGCEICNKEFGVLRRKHKCKRCKRAVCSSCGNVKEIIVGFEANVKHRICIPCQKDSSYQKQFRTINVNKWNFDCKLVEKWLACLEIAELMDVTEKRYKDYLLQAEASENYKKNCQLLANDFNQNKFDIMHFNFSIRDFIYYCQADISKDIIKKNIQNVLHCLFKRYENLSYHTGLGLMTVFLLCFSGEELCFWMLCRLYEDIIPSEFFMPDTQKEENTVGVYKEKNVILTLAKHFRFILTSDEIKVLNFLDLALPYLILPLLVDAVNFQVTFFLWEQMINKASFVEMEKGILILIKMHIKQILSPDMNKDNILDHIMKNTHIDDFRKEMHPIELNDEQRSKITGEPYQALIRKNSLKTSLFGQGRRSQMFASSTFEPGKVKVRNSTYDMSASVPSYKDRSLTQVKEDSVEARTLLSVERKDLNVRNSFENQSLTNIDDDSSPKERGSIFGSSPGVDMWRKLDGLNAEKKTMEIRISELEKQKGMLELEKKRLEQSLKESEGKNSALKDQLLEAEKKLDAQVPNDEISQIKQRNQEFERILRNNTDFLNEASQLMNQENVTFQELLDYIKEVNSNKDMFFKENEELKTELSKQIEDLSEKSLVERELNNKLNDVSLRTDILFQEINEKEALIKSLNEEKELMRSEIIEKEELLKSSQMANDQVAIIEMSKEFEDKLAAANSKIEAKKQKRKELKSKLESSLLAHRNFEEEKGLLLSQKESLLSELATAKAAHEQTTNDLSLEKSLLELRLAKLEEEKASLESERSQLQDAMQAQKKSSEETLRDSASKLEQAQAAFKSSYDEQISGLVAEKKELTDELRRLKADCERDLQKQSEKVAEKQREIEQLKALISASEQLHKNEIEETVAGNEAVISKKEEEIDSLKKALNQSEESTQTMQRELAELRLAFENKEKENERLGRELSANAGQLIFLKEEATLVQSELNRKLSQNAKELEHRQMAQEKLLDEVKKLEEALENYKKENEALSKNINEEIKQRSEASIQAASLANSLEDMSEKFSKVSIDLESVRSQLDEKSREAEGLKEELEKREYDIHSLKKEKDSLKTLSDEYAQQIESLKHQNTLNEETLVRVLQEDNSKLTGEKQGLTVELSQINGELEFKSGVLKKLELELSSERQAFEESLKSTKNELAQYVELSGALKEEKGHLAKSIAEFQTQIQCIQNERETQAKQFSERGQELNSLKAEAEEELRRVQSELTDLNEKLKEEQNKSFALGQAAAVLEAKVAEAEKAGEKLKRERDELLMRNEREKEVLREKFKGLEKKQEKQALLLINEKLDLEKSLKDVQGAFEAYKSSKSFEQITENQAKNLRLIALKEKIELMEEQLLKTSQDENQEIQLVEINKHLEEDLRMSQIEIKSLKENLDLYVKDAHDKIDSREEEILRKSSSPQVQELKAKEDSLVRKISEEAIITRARLEEIEKENGELRALLKESQAKIHELEEKKIFERQASTSLPLSQIKKPEGSGVKASFAEHEPQSRKDERLDSYLDMKNQVITRGEKSFKINNEGKEVPVEKIFKTDEKISNDQQSCQACNQF